MTIKPWKRIQVKKGHLDFYLQHSISPVNQDLKDLSAHLERRSSLYRCAGLLPKFFKNMDILEVAPGSGHNSLYIASCMPENYELCEPNPTAISGIHALYDNFSVPHTRPVIHPVKLEDFNPAHSYDVVICEGWLGSSDHELKMLRKLGDFVKPGGVLVVTTLSPVGILANVLRRILAQHLIKEIDDFDTQTQTLLDAFSPHLATMSDMSRPHKDWIQDNLLNPAYYGICLTPQLVFETIGDDFSFYGTAPKTTTDWRWHKSLFGEQKRYNAHFLDSYYESSHNFIDHSAMLPLRDADENRCFENDCWSLVVMASEWERDGCGEITDLIQIIESIGSAAKIFSSDIGLALDEFLGLLILPSLIPDDVSKMKYFSNLFGRENLYLSLCRDGLES